MKKIFLSALLLVATLPIFAQLNVQMHYDLGKTIYGDELSNRPLFTATVENFKADKWGNTFFFIDLDFGDNTMKSVYAEFAREFNLGKSPFAAHVEYNGGLSGFGSYNDAYLAGAAWNWANKDFSKTFSLQLLYKYLANQPSNNKHSWQVTTGWGIHFAAKVGMAKNLLLIPSVGHTKFLVSSTSAPKLNLKSSSTLSRA